MVLCWYCDDHKMCSDVLIVLCVSVMHLLELNNLALLAVMPLSSYTEAI